jgi:predicted metal-dependent phosphotriesterase family hydrolase
MSFVENFYHIAYLATSTINSFFLTGAPLMIHPGPGEEAPLEILDILEAAGADVNRTVIAHMDRTIFRDENVLRLARRGCYVEYDLFGVECSHYQVVYRSYVCMRVRRYL